jgi:hypothetical protein
MFKKIRKLKLDIRNHLKDLKFFFPILVFQNIYIQVLKYNLIITVLDRKPLYQVYFIDGKIDTQPLSQNKLLIRTKK